VVTSTAPRRSKLRRARGGASPSSSRNAPKENQQADRQVHEEDPAPARSLRQDAAEEDPVAAPSPLIAPQIPSALCRSMPSSKSVVTSDSAAGAISAAPIP